MAGTTITLERAEMLAGVDFTSRPTRRKPITVARGHVDGRGAVQLAGLDAHPSDADFHVWLQAPEPWLAAFDLPFGLPRTLVTALGWPADWLGAMRHYATLTRPEIRATFAAFCDARPVGAKFAHRACDAPAGSSSPMKWVNPPVAYMLHAGVPPMIAAGVGFPAHGHPSDGRHLALEGYPGLLAREVLGRRSYKSDDRQQQTPERLIARKDLVEAMEQGRTRLGVRLRLSHAQRDALVDDGSGDRLDAVLCLLQAAWAAGQQDYGVPPDVDPLEGWIVSAPWG